MLDELKQEAISLVKQHVSWGVTETVLEEWAKSLIRYAVDFDFSDLERAFKGWDVLERLY